jgi:DNA-directed RNA polymerase subunit F
MADLIGTASIRIDMPTAGAVLAIRRMVNQTTGPLRNLQRRIGLVRDDLASLRGASISVTVDDDTGPGTAAVRAAVRDLQQLGPIRINARIDTDTAGTAAATTALRALRDEAQDTARALRGLAAQAVAAAAALRLLGTQARSLRGDMDSLDTSMRRAAATLAGLPDSLTIVTRSAGDAGGALGALRSAALLLSPALLPIAAQAGHLLPIAAGLGAATVAVGVFGAAVAGQVVALKEVAEAEKKAAEAAQTHGASSAEAVKAQDAYRASLSALPPATRTASAAFSVLSDQYREWSDGLADNTMPVATKAFAAFGAVFPKLTPLVEGTSAQLNRFVTIAAGGVQSPGFDRLMKNFAEFSTGVLTRANDALIRFTRTLDTGKMSGAVAQFMEYARENGPLVRDVLSNVAEALGNILEGAANVGPGLLAVVNALAGIVAAVPPGAITAMLQMAIALKAVRLAAAGMAASSAGIAAFGTAITAMRVAAAGATGVLPRLAAAFGTLSRAAKVAVAGTGIGLLVIALTELSQIGRQAPPDVDKLTGSLARLGRSGKVAGEAAKAFGTDLGGLNDKVKSLTDPGTADKVQQFLVGWTGWDSTPVKEAKENLDSVDKALANLVKNGQADLAAAALKRLTAEYGKGGKDTKEFTSRLDDYKASLEDAKFEQQLAADAMGLFGQQAQATSTKLAEQKASADGLRQAVQALNDVNRASAGGMIALEQAIDDSAKAAAENAGALRLVNGELDLNSQAARDVWSAQVDLAAKTDAAASSARESGASWSKVNGIYEQGRQQLIKNLMQQDLSRESAKKLADQILKTPNKTALLKGDLKDLKKKVKDAKAQIKSVPPSKQSELKGKLDDLQKKVKDAKAQIKSVPPSKRSELRATIRQLQNQVAAAKRELASVRSRTVTLKVRRNYAGVAAGTARSGLAAGGRVPRYATGGEIQAFPHGGYVEGPGTPTSDSVLALLGSGARARVADTEYVMRGAAVRKYGVAFMNAVNSMSLGAPALADGGMAGMNVGRSITRSRYSTSGTPTVINQYMTLKMENTGVIGSQMELDNWLAKSLDDLHRTNRLPKSLRRA